MGSPQIEILPILNRLKLFSAFTTEEKRWIVSEETHFERYHSGEMLIRRGSGDRSMYIILNGTVSVTGGQGDAVLAVLNPGDILGEMAFLTGIRRSANVIAREPVIVLKLDKGWFDQLPAEIREKFKDKIIEKLVARLEATNSQLGQINRVEEEAEPDPGQPDKNEKAPSLAEIPETTLASGRDLMRRIANNTSQLPAMPEVMIKVQKMIQMPGTTPGELAKIVETDPAIVAGILKVANSAFYGFRGQVTSIQHASALFGTRRMAELIAASSASGMLGKGLGGYGLKRGVLWRHCIGVAVIASEISTAISGDSLENAYMAGLMHDVGKIILGPTVNQRAHLFDQFFTLNPEKTIQDAERHILGFDHAMIAGMVCDNWNLPKSISFAIRNHHQPEVADDHLLSHIVHLADHYATKAGMSATGKAGGKDLHQDSHFVVGLEPDGLQAIAEKARHYVRSFTGQLQRS